MCGLFRGMLRSLQMLVFPLEGIFISFHSPKLNSNFAAITKLLILLRTVVFTSFHCSGAYVVEDWFVNPAEEVAVRNAGGTIHSSSVSGHTRFPIGCKPVARHEL